MKYHQDPGKKWELICSTNNNEYLITVDYYSDYWELDKIGQNVTATKVINKLKPHFARHGVPDEVISDGGPQYDNEEFRSFSKDYDFKHTITSPHHSKANGKVESAVKAGKKLLKKSKESGTNIYLTLLEPPPSSTQTNKMPVYYLTSLMYGYPHPNCAPGSGKQQTATLLTDPTKHSSI